MKSIINNKENYYLFFILILASVLRFYDAFNIPFTHDEFSALFRANFDGFSELISGGVLPDTHPAGVQVFIYYWIKFFGDSPFSVKFPFIIMGIASIYFLWMLAKRWFNTTVAIIVALLMATLEFPLMHGQIARPYVSGMFLSLWMVFHWQAYLFESKERWNRHLFFYVLASALAAYNHHFSLLFAALVGLSGLLFIDRKRIGAFAIAGLAIFVLYIPHLPIFFSQLEKGGVGGSDGWLGAPEPDFLWQYIRYIFNFSWILLGVAILTFIYSYFSSFKNKAGRKKLALLFLAWFLIPFFIAYYYSIYFNPVIQYSVLIFSFPFFLLFLFAFVKDVNDKMRVLLIVISLPILLFTTLQQRQYYKLFYHSPYKEVIDETIAFNELNVEKKRSLIDSHRQISEYYFSKNNADQTIAYLDDFIDRPSLIEFIKNEEINSLSYGMDALADPVVPLILYDHFPILERKINYNQGNFYIFSKREYEKDKGLSKEKMYRRLISYNDFEAKAEDWNYEESHCVFEDTLSQSLCYEFEKGQEWGVAFEIAFDSIGSMKNDLIDITLDVLSYSDNDELLIVSELYTNEERIDWRATSIKEYAPEEEVQTTFRVYHSIKLSDIKIPKKGAMLKIYAWNKGKTKVKIDNFSIKLRMGNPIFYGLLNEIEKKVKE